MTTKVQFHTREYRLSHMKEPRGYGSWAFRIEGQVHFAPTGTLTSAKQWVREFVSAQNPIAKVVFVDVLP